MSKTDKTDPTAGLHHRAGLSRRRSCDIPPLGWPDQLEEKVCHIQCGVTISVLEPSASQPHDPVTSPFRRKIGLVTEKSRTSAFGTFEACRRKLRMSACRRRPEVTGARSIGVLTRRSRKRKALTRDRGSRPGGRGRSTVPPLAIQENCPRGIGAGPARMDRSLDCSGCDLVSTRFIYRSRSPGHGFVVFQSTTLRSL